MWTTVRRNLQFKLVSELISRVIQFGFILVAARRLGMSDFGVYSYAVAWGFILAQVSDLGLQIFVTRELARQPTDSPQIIGTALSVKTLLSIAAALSLLAMVYTRSEPATSSVILVLALATLLTSYTEFFNYAFRGFQRLEFEAALTLTQRLLGPGLGLIALLLGASLYVVAWELLLAHSIVIALGYYLLQKYFVRPNFQISWTWAWFALKEVLPLGLAIVFSGIYVRTGILMLESMRTLPDAGAWNAALRLTEPMQVLPAIALAAVFPAFAGSASTQVRRAMGGRTLGVLLLLAGTLAFLGWFGADAIVHAVYGPAFAESIGALRWLAIALIPMFLNYALTHFLVALGRQWLNALFTATMLLVNIGVNVSLIPTFGAEGAALAVVISEFTLFILCAAAITSQAIWRQHRTRPYVAILSGTQSNTTPPQ